LVHTTDDISGTRHVRTVERIHGAADVIERRTLAPTELAPVV
jgi:hypothetical protein